MAIFCHANICVQISLYLVTYQSFNPQNPEYKIYCQLLRHSSVGKVCQCPITFSLSKCDKNSFGPKYDFFMLSRASLKNIKVILF